MKMKKLLASALAAAMVVSSMVGAMVTSAETTTVGTITAGTVDATVGETDTVAVPVVIEFTEGIVAPHNIVTVAIQGYTFTSVADVNVTYVEGQGPDAGKDNVDVDPDGSNLSVGKILLETAVDETAPTVTKIAFTANFTDADDVDTVAGTYPITVNGDDMTDVNERTIGITAVPGSLTVAEAAHVCTPAEAVVENNVDPTCGVAGSYDSVIYCSECGEEISRKTITVEATGEHNYVDGTCDVCGAEDPDYEPPVADPVFLGTVYDVTGGATGGYQLNGKATFGFENATAKEYGVLFYRAAAFDPNNISFENASLTKSSGTKTSDTMSVTGFAFEFIVEKFVFVPYGVDTDGNYYYGEAVHYSYVDYLKTRETNTAAIGTKARAMLNAYYAIYGAPYDGYVYTGPDAFEYDGPYVATNPRGKIADGEYAFVPTFTGSTKNNPINIKGDFSAYDGPAAQEYGFMVMRESSYKVGDTISIEKAALSAPLGNKGASPKSISSFANLGESFVFVLYIKDVNGDYHYGDVWQSSYADYLVEKLNAGVPSASSTAKTTALKADLLLEADALVFNRTLHTKG